MSSPKNNVQDFVFDRNVYGAYVAGNEFEIYYESWVLHGEHNDRYMNVKLFYCVDPSLPVEKRTYYMAYQRRVNYMKEFKAEAFEHYREELYGQKYEDYDEFMKAFDKVMMPYLCTWEELYMNRNMYKKGTRILPEQVLNWNGPVWSEDYYWEMKKKQDIEEANRLKKIKEKESEELRKKLAENQKKREELKKKTLHEIPKEFYKDKGVFDGEEDEDSSTSSKNSSKKRGFLGFFKK